MWLVLEKVELVYHFGKMYMALMSCIGKEVVEDAPQQKIVDVVDSRDIVTETFVLHTFDIMTIKVVPSISFMQEHSKRILRLCNSRKLQ